jgi:HPt (histidine-containing phosphotransfer) domain-containing protein
MDALLTKPLAVEALQETLERYGLAMNESELNESAVAELVMTPAEAVPIDLAQLKELAGDDAEFIRSIAESFASSSTQLLAALRTAAATGDVVAMSKAAHALKGASANLYAEKLAADSAALEASGGKFAKPELEKLIAQMTHESERVSAALYGLASTTAASAVG